MKLWEKPVLVIYDAVRVNEYIKTNAATCLTRFLRLL